VWIEMLGKIFAHSGKQTGVSAMAKEGGSDQGPRPPGSHRVTKATKEKAELESAEPRVFGGAGPRTPRIASSTRMIGVRLSEPWRRR